MRRSYLQPSTMTLYTPAATPLAVVLALTCAAACGLAQNPQPTSGRVALATLDAHAVIPAPTSVVPGTGASFALSATTAVVVPSGNAEVARIGEALARRLRPATGF